MKIKLFIKLFIICLFAAACASKEEIIIDNDKRIIPENENKKYPEHASPFYPMKESIEDLQYQIRELKARVSEYESSLHAPTLNSELLKLIKVPQIEHELIMDNGTIIQGKIITEDANQMVVQTRIGQLKIDKEYVKSITNIEPLSPEIIFNESSIEEKISPTNLTFSGTLTNEGGRRADFVRVIYYLWETDTKLALEDSVFIAGNSVIYNNNVISSSALDPGKEGEYLLSIAIPDTVTVTYWTKDVKFNIFE